MFWYFALLAFLVFIFADYANYFYMRRKKRVLKLSKRISLVLSAVLPMVAGTEVLKLHNLSDAQIQVGVVLLSGLTCLLVVLSEMYRFKDEKSTK